MYQHPSDSELKRIFEETRTIAVVGFSSDSTRAGYTVPAYLKEAGYRIIPVNPNLEEALGEKAYPDLISVEGPVDLVEIFRRPEHIPPIVEQSIQINAKTVWMQLGIRNEGAAEMANAAGLKVVMDACMLVDHKRLFGG
jgi:predicted CoA-binding protein